jgi:ABC-type amino acid transport substrate-binding protein
VRSGAKLARLVDLKNRRVAVIPGTTTEHALTAELSALGVAATLVPVSNGAEGVAQLVAGKVDALAGDRIVLTALRQRAAKPGALTLVGADFSYEPYALVVRRDDPDFRLAVNRALVAVYRSGEIDGIFQRWEIVVKMDRGGVRTVTNDYEPALREGDRVRVYGTQLELVP